MWSASSRSCSSTRPTWTSGSRASSAMASTEAGKRANPALYGGMPAAPGPAGMAPRLLEFADELRSEGVAVGTSELLDAFDALDAVSWSSQDDFREALAATLAKSQEDRHVLDVLFDRFFFRAVEREAIDRGLAEERFEGAEQLDLDALRQRLQEFERHVRRELERQMIERTQALPPAKPLRELDRALPSNPAQDLSQVHRTVAQLKKRLASQGRDHRGRRRSWQGGGGPTPR